MKDKWDTHWQEKKLHEVMAEIKQVQRSTMTKAIHTVLKQEFGSLSRVNSIEIGSGLGLDSLILGKNGAKVTLLDYSDVAIDLARKLYSLNRLNPTLIKSNVFNIKPSLKGKFNVVMSFGLAEHYYDDDRVKIIKVHLDLVKQDGLIVVSVPNRYCPPYQIAKLIQGWDERPFTKRELKDICDRLNCEIILIGGFGFLDFKAQILNHIFKSDIVLPNTPRFIDNFMGYALLLIARKRAN